MTLEYIHKKFTDGQLGIKCSNNDERTFIFDYGNEVLGLPKASLSTYNPNYPYVAYLFGSIVGWNGYWSGEAPEKITFNDFICAVNKQQEDDIIGVEELL